MFSHFSMYCFLVSVVLIWYISIFWMPNLCLLTCLLLVLLVNNYGPMLLSVACTWVLVWINMATGGVVQLFANTMCTFSHNVSLYSKLFFNDFLATFSVSSQVFSSASSSTPMILILLHLEWFSRYSVLDSRASIPLFRFWFRPLIWW